jgi:sulfide:quinone oxidoreductase
LNDILWHKNIFDFYTIEGALKLANFFRHFDEGKLVLHITEMPIKCPVAPLEFAFLADWFFTKKGVRDKIEISFVTPLPGAFTKPKAASVLGDFLQKKIYI